MSRQNIRKYSWGYALVGLISGLFHRLYYRKFILKFREKIPADRPVIFALNHQNALMDALTIVYTMPRQVVFMARADIFKKKMVAGILYFLKILPAYRIRDGFHSVDQNKDVFKEVIGAMEYGRPVAILPEGNHFGEKRLRPLKKGAARLALLAEEANGFNLGVSIVPVGIDYSNYYKAGSDLLVVFGDPIPGAAYREQYLENPTLAINNLTNDLAVAMKKVMIDIGPEEHYQTFYDAIEIYTPVELKKQKLRPTLWNSFRIKKELSEKLARNTPGNEKGIGDLQAGLSSYREKLASYAIRDLQVATSLNNSALFFFKIFLTAILIPIHLYGMILNYLPYGLPIYLARNIKDKHFLSSVRFVYGLIFFFTWYLVLAVISFFFFDSIILNICFIISLPLTGLFAFYYYIHMLRLRGKFRWLSLKLRNKKVFEGIVEQRKDIMRKIEEMLGW